jgi:succinate-semialdehyde dehydrogenase / glutarate-semialdehyde dehydrogenase
MKLWNKALIGGQYINDENKKQYSILNPATNEEIARCQLMAREDAILAVEAAKSAFKKFARTTASERSKLLSDYSDLINKHADELAMTVSLENGKSLSEARKEIDYANHYIQWFSKQAENVYGETRNAFARNKFSYSIYQPIGVVAAITPWNFPLAMITRKLAPAIAAGCSIIIKPSEETPLSAYMLGKLATDAGIPEGVVNIISGDAKEIGDVLTASSDVRMLTFTGSTAVGKMLAQKCAATVKKTALELGGNAPYIVFEDADIEHAARDLFNAKLRNNSQSCTSPNRIYVHENVINEFIAKMKEHFESIYVDNALNPKANITALINRAAVEKANKLVDDALRNGSELVHRTNLDHLKSSTGNFFAPCILHNKSRGLTIEETEIFAPVVSIFTFSGEEEVIERANSTNYGLASYFYTQDYKRIQRVSNALEFGMVGVNDFFVSHPSINFGGVKESGIGKEGGSHGMQEYMELKEVVLAFLMPNI